MIIPYGVNIWRSGPNSLPTSPTGSEAKSAKTKPSLCGCNRAAARTSPSSVKSRCGGPPTASTPATHEQPEQHSCGQPRRSGNTTSTEVSPAAATTSVILTSQNVRPRQPHVVADTKIDSTCNSHPRSTRTRHPAPAYRSAPPRRGGCRPPTTWRAEDDSRQAGPSSDTPAGFGSWWPAAGWAP
jgi:hypothetical protein